MSAEGFYCPPAALEALNQLLLVKNHKFSKDELIFTEGFLLPPAQRNHFAFIFDNLFTNKAEMCRPTVRLF